MSKTKQAQKPNFYLKNLDLEFRPLTPENWQDFEKLFGPKGACGGCWCMWWRLKRSEFEKQKGEDNRQAMKEIVHSGKIPGILAYDNDRPIAWCSVAPRENFSLLERSRILKPNDDKSVWSIVCLFVAKQFRRKGITPLFLKAAIEYARKNGVKIIEGYPIDTNKNNYPVVFAGTGFTSAFRKAGFVEILRRSETRPIMRYMIEDK